MADATIVGLPLQGSKAPASDTTKKKALTRISRECFFDFKLHRYEPIARHRPYTSYAEYAAPFPCYAVIS